LLLHQTIINSEILTADRGLVTESVKVVVAAAAGAGFVGVVVLALPAVELLFVTAALAAAAAFAFFQQSTQLGCLLINLTVASSTVPQVVHLKHAA
jgi:hypothetical protein